MKVFITEDVAIKQVTVSELAYYHYCLFQMIFLMKVAPQQEQQGSCRVEKFL